jgi:hypothetical protein
MNDKVPAGKYAVSTSNRNFGTSPGSRTLLASPIMAAAAAVTGVLTDKRFVLKDFRLKITFLIALVRFASKSQISLRFILKEFN